MASETEASRLSIWPSRRRLVVWCIVTFLIWAICAGWILFSAQSDARDGEAALRSVADLSDPTEVDLDVVSEALVEGGGSLSSARRKLGSFILTPLKPLPIVGRQITSAQALVVVSDDLVKELEPLVTRANEVRNDPNDIDRVAFLQEVADRLGRVEAVIDNADLGPDENLVGPLAEGRIELAQRLGELDEQVSQYRTIAAGMAVFLDDSNYLLLGANNAEMRLGMGMHLSVGRFATVDGDFDLPGLAPASTFAPITGGTIVDEDVDRMWGFITVDQDFRAIAYSGRFDEAVAPQALALWEAETGQRLDGVLMVDPFVLDALLGVIGEVEVDGETYSQGGALEYLLREQYTVFDDQVEERQDVLSVMAQAVVDRFGSTSWDPVELIRELEPVARGRHIMVYSNDPAQQAAWQAMGVDGSLEGDETGVFLLNNGASKLDPLVRLTVDATAMEGPERTTINYEITITNQAPATGLPSYVTGPWTTVGLPEEGTYLGRVVVYSPAGVIEADFVGDLEIDAAGPDGSVFLVSTQPLELTPGETTVLNFEMVVPSTRSAMTLLPTARFPPVNWTWNGESFNDARPRILTLGE